MLKAMLWKPQSRWQRYSAALGTLIGFLLLFVALQVYFDVQALSAGNRDGNYLVVNKKVDIKNTLFNASTNFTDEEIEDFGQQRFVKQVGTFTSNQFKVSISLPQFRFFTFLFLQSIPMDFVDVDASASSFKWNETQDEVPIILSNDYLALYNFGFAPSQGLPPFTTESIQSVSFNLDVSGQGRKRRFKARIVGFSRRINSILVPPSFLTYANAEFGEDKKPPTQLIFSTDQPYSPELTNYLEEKKYELSRGALIGGELKATLQFVVLIIALIGGIIMGLALLVFLLNFRLLISQAAHNIELLSQLGYPHTQLSSILLTRFSRLFGLAIGIALVLGLILKVGMTHWFATQGYALSYMPHLVVILVLSAFSIGFFYLNRRSIQQHVKQLAQAH